MSIQNLVAENRLEEALNLLGNSNEVIALKSRLNQWNADDRMNLSPSPTELNRIRQAILYYGNNIVVDLSTTNINITTPVSQNVNDVCKYISSQMNLQELVTYLLTLFKSNRDYLVKFLPLKQEYETAVLLDGGLSLDQTKVWKQNLAALYTEFATGQVEAKHKEDKQDLDDAHAILKQVSISKSELLRAIDFTLLFFINNGKRFYGQNQVESLKEEINSKNNQLLESTRPVRFQSYISEKHQWLKDVVGRMISRIAEDQLNQL